MPSQNKSPALSQNKRASKLNVLWSPNSDVQRAFLADVAAVMHGD